MSHAAFQLEPFRPAIGISNPHLQSFAGHYLRNQHDITFRRKRIETPDDDFLDLDFADVAGTTWAQLGEAAPVVLLLHGLEGSARRGYMCEGYRQLAQHGIRPVGLNYRSCSGEMNRRIPSYHAGATADVALVFEQLEQWFPNVPKGMVGFSLGGSMLLKYMGENGSDLLGRLEAAVAVSPPFDLAAGSRWMEGVLGGLYSRYFLRKLQRKTKAKAAQLQDKMDVERALNATTLYDFDHCWAPLNHFSDALDYYAQASCPQFMPNIQLPTLILRALDDPFFPKEDIPYAIIEANPHLQGHFPTHGGHMGFVEGVPWRYRYWAERQVARFLAHRLLHSGTGDM